MRWLLAAHVPVLTLVLASCGSSPDAPRSASPNATTSASRAASPTSTPATTRTAASTSKVKDCFDGDCLLQVSKPVDIRLDTKKFYYPELAIVAVDASGISYRVDYPHGGSAQQVLSPGSGSSFGFRSYTPVEVKLVSINKRKALIAISPGKHP